MIGSIVEFQDLQQLSGYQRLSDVERWALKNGITYKYNRAGVWTTVEAINFALGVGPDPMAPYPADII